jgi:tRNA/tmRNA/rRNA uracil-C5-methylase (TrmA/RlmC/RlmD family)
VPISLSVGSLVGWRTRSKLAVRGTVSTPQIGLIKRGTHEVIGIPDCPLHHPYLNRACASAREQMIASKIEPYHELKRSGVLRYLQFAVERKNRKIQLAVVINRQGRDPQIDKFVKQLYSTGQFLGIWVNLQPEATNRIFGESWYLAEGEPYLTEKLGGIEISLHPACFAQAHLELFEQILSSIRSSILPGQRVVEFYAGVGVIGLNCAEKSRHVVCSEINPYAERCFQLSKLKLPLAVQEKIEFREGDAGAMCHLADEADVVIVDPPRKGLDPKLLKKLCEAPHLKQLVYLSCGFFSFKQECERLMEHGWRIEKAEGYLLFPGSDHVETLCVLKKTGNLM